jgi:hypothetical protein
LSTTTCNFPPVEALIASKRALMRSRAHPIPRFGSSHEESVSRVPHPTNSEISNRIPFSSTA